jgi:hypothetical protein
LSAAITEWHSEVPHAMCDGALADRFSEDQTGKNPMVQGQDFKMGVATLSTQIM